MILKFADKLVWSRFSREGRLENKVTVKTSLFGSRVLIGERGLLVEWTPRQLHVRSATQQLLWSYSCSVGHQLVQVLLDGYDMFLLLRSGTGSLQLLSAAIGSATVSCRRLAPCTIDKNKPVCLAILPWALVLATESGFRFYARKTGKLQWSFRRDFWGLQSILLVDNIIYVLCGEEGSLSRFDVSKVQMSRDMQAMLAGQKRERRAKVPSFAQPRNRPKLQRRFIKTRIRE